MTLESPPRTAGRIAELDALRGIAALAVVLFHYTTRYREQFGGFPDPLFEVPWGHFGVQLFFVISGFVIFMTLDRTRSLTDFAVSRFSRLYPAYWAAIILTTLVMALVGPREFVQPMDVILINLTMIQNFVGVPPVDGVYWTLSVELAFYVAMAALWRLGLLTRIEPVLLGWIGIKWMWTFAPSVAGVELSWLLGALLIQEYIPFFSIGIAAYRLKSGGDRSWAWAVIAAALLTVAVCDDMAHLIVALVAGAAVLLVALRGARPLSARPLLWLGAISYSLYLLHQLIGFTVMRHLQAAGVAMPLALALTFAAVLALAAAVTFLIERPILHAIRRWYRGRETSRACTA